MQQYSKLVPELAHSKAKYHRNQDLVIHVGVVQQPQVSASLGELLHLLVTGGPGVSGLALVLLS